MYDSTSYIAYLLERVASSIESLDIPGKSEDVLAPSP